MQHGAGYTGAGGGKADELRVETGRILMRKPSLASNMSGMERKALHERRDNERLVILPDGKGNASIVLD